MTATPSAETVEEAVRLASRAPSVHNTQPWQWRYAAGTMELFADRTRRLALEDPYGRSLLISCGASLHHFVVAMEARGWASKVRRLPDPQVPGLLAVISFRPEPASARSIHWAEAIERRRSDRRPMSSWPVPAQQVAGLTQVAREHGAILEVLDNGVGIHVWETLAASVIELRQGDTAYERELGTWTRVPPHSRSGVPTENLVADTASPWGPPAPDRLPPGTLRSGPDEPDPPQSVPLLLTTSSEDPMSCLRAGEALSAILLEATRRRLATRIDSQVVEVEAARQIFEDQVLDGTKSAQLLIRVGWPVDDAEIPATPRRETSDALTQRYVPTAPERTSLHPGYKPVNVKQGRRVMRAVVIYESMYGNTHKVAQYIASGLSTALEAELISTGDVAAEGLPEVDLIVAGGPTHAHGMTRPSTRKAAVDAARDPDKHLEVDRNADAPGVREWLDTLGSLDGWAASFDTRVHGPSALTGRASRGIAKQLQRHGCSLLVAPESFLVSKDNVLLPGEDERAEAWGRSLAHRLMGGALATTP